MTVWVFLHAEGFSFKKKTLHAAEQDRPDVAAAPGAWREDQNRIEPYRLVFIDETWIKTNMARLRFWAPRGRLSAVPPGHWQTSTFIAALRCDASPPPA